MRSLLALLASTGLAVAVPASAQGVAPEAAPAEWLHYAEAARAAVTAWLSEEGGAPARVRAALDRTRPAPDQPTLPIALKVWIEPNGRIARLDFSPFAEPTVEDDLRATIVGRMLAAPPIGMEQPIRLAVLLPAPAAAPPPVPRA